jgi:hypothetical protein
VARAKRTATNHCRIYRVPVRHTAGSVDWQLEVRVFDDGFAYPTASRRRQPAHPGRASSWTLPAEGEAVPDEHRDYEGAYQRQRPAAIPARRAPIAVPGRSIWSTVTMELPQGVSADH